MYNKAFLDQIIKEEEELEFTSFDQDDAYKLGLMLVDFSYKCPKHISVRVVLDDLIVFQALISQTSSRNLWWMDKKRATIEKTHKSSLRVAVEKELFDLQDSWMNDEEHYALCGGGFPIIVNKEYRGSVIVSGLPHLDDHKCLVETIRRYKEEQNGALVSIQ